MGFGILCIADAHGREAALAALEKFLGRKPDLALVAGDVTHRGGPPGFLEKFFGAIEKAGVPVLAVHGNMDSPQVREWLAAKGLELHGKRVSFKGIDFAGLGGGAVSPLHTLIEYSEEEIARVLAPLVGPNTIILSHAPPWGTKADDIGEGIHVGSVALRKIIEERRPLAVVCGHAHETQGTEMVGKTLVVKVPPLMHGKAAWLELPSLEAVFLE